jgi:spermidine synthase
VLDTEREREREFGIVCTWHTLPRFQQKEKKKQQREFSIVNNICLSNYLFVAPVTNTSWGTSIYLDQIERDRGLYSEQKKKNETRYYTASF